MGKDFGRVFKVFDNLSVARGSFPNLKKTEMLPITSATTAKYQNMIVEKIKICWVIFLLQSTKKWQTIINYQF